MNKKNIFIFLFFVVAGFLPFFLYGSSVITSTYNELGHLPLNFFLTSWTREAGGSPAFFFIPFDLIIYLLMKILTQSIAIQLSFGLILFSALLCSYRLATRIFGSWQIGIVGSLVYSFSIYGQFMSTWAIHSGAGVFALAPLFVERFLTIKRGDNVLTSGFLLGLLTIFFININLAFVAYLFAFLFIIIIFRFFASPRHDLKNLIILFLITVVSYFLIAAPFFVQFISSSLIKTNSLSQSLSAESVDWKSSASYLHELLREMGSLNYYYSYNDVRAYPNAQIFISNSLFVISSYLVTFFALVSIVIRSKDKYMEHLKLFLLIVLVLSFFLGMGVFPLSPTRFIYRYLADVIPYFSVFRDTYKVMFIVNMIYMIFLCYVLLHLQKISKKIYYSGIIAITFLIMLNSYQYWSGNFLNHQIIKIPSYWQSFSSDYKDMDRSIILFLPKSPFPVYTFTKNRGVNTFFYRNILEFSTINAYSITYSPENIIFDSMHKNYAKNEYSKIAGFYGIKYSLLQWDTDWSYYRQLSPKDIEKNIDPQLHLVKKYEK